MGKRIKAAREKLVDPDTGKKLTAEQFARRVELTGGHYSCIERGERMPRDRKLARICNELGLVLRWICTGKGRKFLRAGESNAVEGCD